MTGWADRENARRYRAFERRHGMERAYEGYDRDRVEVVRWMAFRCRPDGGGSR